MTFYLDLTFTIRTSSFRARTKILSILNKRRVSVYLKLFISHVNMISHSNTFYIRIMKWKVSIYLKLNIIPLAF